MEKYTPLIFVVLASLVVLMRCNSNLKDKNNDLLLEEIRDLQDSFELRVMQERAEENKAAYKKAKDYYDSLPSKVVVKEKIIRKYEKTVDSILVLPDSAKFEYIRSELRRLYGPSNTPD
jgi:hypothetical protein